MMKFNKLIFFNLLIIGTLLSVSSYSWLSMWMGLEINLMAMIPLMISPQNKYSSESTLKYFISQTLASMFLLFSMILTVSSTLQTFLNMNMLMNFALLMKLGAAPLHFWFTEIIEGLNWINCLILFTWQKIAPLILLNYNMKFNNMILIFIIISSLTGSLMGINQTNLRKLMTYSSINHISWMLCALLYNSSIWVIYFLIYVILSINIMLIFNHFKIYNFNQMINMLNHNKYFKLIFMFNFFSFSGLPPFLGFFPKWLIMNLLINNSMILLTTILIIMNLLAIFYYIQLTLSSILMNYSITKTSFNFKINFIYLLFNNLLILMLPIMTLFYNSY